jgi:hypothetical protein
MCPRFARLKWGLCAFYALEVVFPLRTAPLQRALLVILYHHKRPAYRYALDTFPLPTEFTTPFGARKNVLGKEPRLWNCLQLPRSPRTEILRSLGNLSCKPRCHRGPEGVVL